MQGKGELLEYPPRLLLRQAYPGGQQAGQVSAGRMLQRHHQVLLGEKELRAEKGWGEGLLLRSRPGAWDQHNTAPHQNRRSSQQDAVPQPQPPPLA